MQKIVKARNGWLDFMVGRGCPFNCSFCFNHKARFLNDNTPDYVRMRQPEIVINELEKVMSSVPRIKTISFVDDTFTLNKKWLSDFTSLYKLRINKPYVINTTANLIDDYTIKLLKNSNCNLIRVGLETYSERVRKLILHKYISNTHFENAINLIKSNGIKVLTYNMIGLPTETIQDMSNTIKFNSINKVDVVRISTFFPFKYTDIYSYCFKNNLIRKDVAKPKSFDSGIAVLKFSKEEEEFILKLQKYFNIWLSYYIPENKSNYENLISKITYSDKKKYYLKNLNPK